MVDALARRFSGECHHSPLSLIGPILTIRRFPDSPWVQTISCDWVR
jgi:hypothetical protein